jgi:hypothetical protein
MDELKHLELCCPNCHAEYRMPVKYCGMNALCEKCNILFEIPSREDLQAAEEVVTPEMPTSTVSTDTVRIERPHRHMGMVPDPNFTSSVDTRDFILPKSTPKKPRRQFILARKS